MTTNKDVVIGVYSISSFGGIEILEVNDATVKWRYNFGEPKEAKESTIYYFENGEGGFMADGDIVEFSEILRVNY